MKRRIPLFSLVQIERHSAEPRYMRLVFGGSLQKVYEVYFESEEQATLFEQCAFAVSFQARKMVSSSGLGSRTL